MHSQTDIDTFGNSSPVKYDINIARYVASNALTCLNTDIKVSKVSIRSGPGVPDCQSSNRKHATSKPTAMTMMSDHWQIRAAFIANNTGRRQALQTRRLHT